MASWIVAASAAAGVVRTVVAVELSGELAPGEPPLTFAVFGDCGDRLEYNPPARVAAMVRRWDPDLILAAGDLNYGSTAVGHRDWDERIGLRYGSFILGRTDGRFRRQTSPDQRFFPVVGNHDTDVGGLGGGDVSGYVDYFVRNAPGFPDRLPAGSGVHTDQASYYDFRRGDAHFVMADSDRGRVDDDFAAAQRAWIRGVLEASDARWKFVVFHHPAWSSDNVHGSQLWMRGPDDGAYLDAADAVFAAHAHVYERLDIRGTPFFTCGAGGRSFYDFRETLRPESLAQYKEFHGALRARVGAAGVRFEFLSLDDGAWGQHGGRVIDALDLGEFTAVRNEDARWFTAVAGQRLAVEGFVEGGTDAVVELVDSGGVSVASWAPDPGAAEGTLVPIDLGHEVVERPGRWRLRIRATGARGGAYQFGLAAEPALPASPVEAWRVRWFGFAPDAGVAGDLDDPDGDRADNLLEYTFGTDPTHPGSLPSFSAEVLDRVVILRFRLLEGVRDDLEYRLEWLQPGAAQWVVVTGKFAGQPWSAERTVPYEIPDAGGGEGVVLETVRGRYPLSGYRLRVIRR